MAATPVDRGMSWVVLGVCVTNSAIALGVAQSCGVYVAAMIDHYHSSRAEGYVVGSLSFGLLYASGLLGSVLIERSSHRAVAMFGGVLACVGLVLAANVPTLYLQYIATSLTAIGCGFMFQSSVVVLVYYFRKYRALATGATLAGGGVGVLLYPLLALALIDRYTWQPSLYIVAGICLNSCVGSALIRPVNQAHKITTETEGSKDHVVEDEITESLNKDRTSHDGDQKTYDDEFTELMDRPTSDVTDNRSVMTDSRSNVTDNRPYVTDNCSNCTDSLPYVTDNRPDVPAVDKGDMERVIVEYDRQDELCIKGDGKLIHNRSFLMLLAGALLWSAPCSVPFVITADMYNSISLPVTQQGVLFTALGVCGVIGRFVSGIVIDLQITSAGRIYCILNFIWGAGLALFLLNDSYVCLIVANIVVGLVFGWFIGGYSLVTLEMVGLKDLNTAFGFVNLAIGVSSTLLTPMFGVIYDATHSYTWPMLAAAMLAVISAAVIVPPVFIWSKDRQMVQCGVRVVTGEAERFTPGGGATIKNYGACRRACEYK